MFRKVLIANRGEIAVRVMQACDELGIASVAVYSDADAAALHVRRASEAVRIGAPPATQSYLSIEAILAAAAATGADAIHPGYGFLSESPRFADACSEADIVFVGPSAATMRLLGSKREAKLLARRIGVPVVPGYDGADQSPVALAEEAARVGFPLLIKASAGGGGRGMRVVRSEADFAEALAAAKRESLSAFGDDAVLLERLIEHPRHIEFQILADTHGAVIHLGERECSIQRRHQKVIEESPSVALTPTLRAAMGAAAVAIAREAKYVSTGTVEFIVAPGGEFYFLEVNTRLQVEHPVTEAVTGVDLVHEQLRVAAGGALPMRQEQIVLRGHAIECRIYAEDASTGFTPSVGTLDLFRPPLAVGVRNDVGVEAGADITPFYDSMLAKLIAWAPDRRTCIRRTLHALRHYATGGVTTNVPLLTAVVASPEFGAGDISTAFLDDELPKILESMPVPAVHVAHTAPVSVAPPRPGNAQDFNPWRSARFTTPSQTLRPAPRAPGLSIDDFATGAAESASGWRVEAPLPGVVAKVAVAAGNSVVAGQTVVVIEAMKMEIGVQAPMAGTVARVACAPGDIVKAQAILIELE
jgi:3-methylcrotonyl-CoA carboxylase alpha subunit